MEALIQSFTPDTNARYIKSLKHLFLTIQNTIYYIFIKGICSIVFHFSLSVVNVSGIVFVILLIILIFSKDIHVHKLI